VYLFRSFPESMGPASNTTPLLSVIVPTCHRNEDLGHCLEALQPRDDETIIASVVIKTIRTKNFVYEVIVTDDGLRGTAEGLISERYRWARWCAGPRRGPAANRNSGARNSQGEWLLFLDDDCVPLSSWLEAYASATHQFPDYSVFEGQTVAPQPQQRSDHESPINVKGGLLWSCNFGIKRTLFLEVGGFDEKFPVPAMEDMDLQFRLKQAGYTSKFLPEACAQHPWRPRRGTRFCLSLAKSVQYFTTKHPQARPIFDVTWGFKRMVKIAVFEFPANLRRFRDLSAFRVLYLDLLTAVRITWILRYKRQ
jgi:GT2 family glycosyltransferase